MRRSRYADSKMAQAGDRDDDSDVLMAMPVSAYKPLVVSRSSVSTNRGSTVPVGAQMDFIPMEGEKRVVEEEPYDIGMSRFFDTMLTCPLGWIPGMSRFLQDDREMVVEFGQHTANKNLNMALGYANGHQLNFGKITNPYIVKNNLDENLIVLEKLHPMVYRFTMDRKNIVDIGEEPFVGVLLEAAFSSRVIGSDKMDYLGKIKVFFPKTSSKMVMYLDLSKIK